MLEIKLQQINYILLKCFSNKQKEERNKGISEKKLKLEKEKFDNYLDYEISIEGIFGTDTLNIEGSTDVEDTLKRKML